MGVAVVRIAYLCKGKGVDRTKFEREWKNKYGSHGEYCAWYIEEGEEGRQMLYGLTARLANGGNGADATNLRMWLEGLNSGVRDGKESFESFTCEGKAESKKQFLMRNVMQDIETDKIVTGNLTKDFILKLSDDAELK